jgi:glycosyltransferase involved in cell wall biosynthesis
MPLSSINKKWSSIPLLLHIIKIIAMAKGPVEIMAGNVYAGCVAYMASLILKNVDYQVYTYGTELIHLKKNTMKNRLLKKVLNKASGLNALGEYTARLLHEAGIRQESKIVPPRIELPAAGLRFGAALATMASEPLNVLCVGRLVPHKGHTVLIKALAIIPREVQWQCVIVGGGPLLDRLSAMAKQYKVDDRVTIKTGISDDELWNEFNNASLFVLPSLVDNGAEGFGIVLLEAMARGVPVVASKTGGVPEVLNNGACGMLAEPGDAPGLAAAMLSVHQDKRLAQNLAKNAFDRVRSRYAW